MLAYLQSFTPTVRGKQNANLTEASSEVLLWLVLPFLNQWLTPHNVHGHQFK